jgi:deoxyribonuclease V
VAAGSSHSWSVSSEQAQEIQKRLAASVRIERPGSEIRLVAGADCSYPGEGILCLAAVAVWDLGSRSLVEVRTAAAEASFSYVPGLLAFREAPAVLRALELLSIEPDLLLCDGHGLAHPRRLGLACHLGVLSGIRTAGCARRLLCGSYDEPGDRRGEKTPLVDKGEVIGTVLRTRSAVKPVFVSVGHRIDLDTAERAILACAVRYRLPEPLRLAHQAAAGAIS